MKKSITLIAIISVLCLSLTGCKSALPTLTENLDAKIATQNYNISGVLKVNDDNYSFKGRHANNITDVSLSKNEVVDYSQIIMDNNNIYLKNGEIVQDLEKTFDELEETDSEYIHISAGHEKVNLGNLDFNIINKYLNISLKNTLNTYVSANEDLAIIEDNVISVNLEGEQASKFVKDMTNLLINNVSTIYDEMISSAPEEMQNKYKSSREKNTQKLTAFFTGLQDNLSIADGAKLSYKNKYVDGVYQDVFSISDNTKNISLNVTITPNNEGSVVIPENHIGILDLKPISEEEQRLQLDEFYAMKYPEAAQMRANLVGIGYDSPKYTTSLDGISLYGTRGSKSMGFDYGVVDEIVVDFMDGWLSEVTMISCFSEKDFEMYGVGVLNTYIEEMEYLIDDDFLIEIGDGVGYYENIMDDWEFYVTVSELEIKDSGLVTVELVAKQH